MKENDEVSEDLINILEDLDERLGEITTEVRKSDGLFIRDSSEQVKEDEKNEDPNFPGNTTRN